MGFRNAEILAGGAEARRSRPGWASWEQLWPKVDVYEPSPGDAGEASFDVSDVDVTKFPFAQKDRLFDLGIGLPSMEALP